MVGVAVGAAVGVAVGAAVGVAVGAAVGVAVGGGVGVAVGTAVGVAVGAAVGVAVGAAVGVAVGGGGVGVAVGASVGVAGTLAGLGIGLVFCANIETIRRWLEGLTGTELFAAEIYFLSRLPAEVETGDVIAITAMALGLSLLATIYPSWRAALLDPVVALRNE